MSESGALDESEVCPKCGAPKLPPDAPRTPLAAVTNEPQIAACRRCGLRFERWAAFARNATQELTPALADAWAKLITDEEWASDAAHRKFLDLAMHTDELDRAAALYRSRLVTAPGDPWAQAGLARAVERVTLALAKEPRFTIPVWANRVGILVAAALVGVVLVLLRLVLRSWH